MDERRWFCGLALTLACASAAPAAAQPSNGRWTSRVLFGRVMPGSDPVRVDLGDGRHADMKADSGTAVLYDLSYRLLTRMDVQVGLGLWSAPSTLSPGGSLRGFHPGEFHLGVVYGVSAARRVTLYGGPLIVGTSREVAVGRDDRTIVVTMSSKVGPGLQGGILVGGCGMERVALDINVRRTALRPPVSGGAPFYLDPWVVSAGLTIRHR